MDTKGKHIIKLFILLNASYSSKIYFDITSFIILLANMIFIWNILTKLIIGGGLTHYELGNMKYMRLVYGEGLRVPKM